MSLIDEWNALLQRHSLQGGTITITRMEGMTNAAYSASIKDIALNGSVLSIIIEGGVRAAQADQTGLNTGPWKEVSNYDPELFSYNLGMIMTTPPVESSRGIVFTSLTAQIILRPAT